MKFPGKINVLKKHQIMELIILTIIVTCQWLNKLYCLIPYKNNTFKRTKTNLQQSNLLQNPFKV